MLAPGNILWDKYEILRVLGQGGMSTVYLAMDTHLNKQWAIKELLYSREDKIHRIYKESFLREANLMKSLDHVAFPRIVDIVFEEGSIYIVMDYIEGENLDRVIKDTGREESGLVTKQMLEVSSAIAYLHGLNPPVLYKDMKPANLIMKPEGNIKIIDFGIAKECKDFASNDGLVLGTRGFAAPEQLEGIDDIRSDIYSMGMTMYYLLKGEYPSEIAQAVLEYQDNSDKIVDEILERTIEDESDRIIISRCVRWDRNKRYESCEQLAYDLSHPKLLTRSYRRKRKTILSGLVISAAVCISSLVIGVLSFLGIDRAKEVSYHNLTTISESTSTDTKRDSYLRAISIYPSRAEGYMRLLESYQDDGSFQKEEQDEFLECFNRNKGRLEKEEEYKLLCKKAATLYFLYYEGSFGERVQKAYAFFELSGDRGLYYEICSFYKQYVLNTRHSREAGSKEYKELIEKLGVRLREIALEDEKGEGDLEFENGVFMLLYDQRNILPEKGIEEKEVLDLMELIRSCVEDMKVSKKQAVELKKEIEDNYSKYYEDIRRCYEAGRKKT